MENSPSHEHLARLWGHINPHHSTTAQEYNTELRRLYLEISRTTTIKKELQNEPSFDILEKLRGQHIAKRVSITANSFLHLKKCKVPTNFTPQNSFPILHKKFERKKTPFQRQ
jgi:hypothetical protein